MGPRNDVPQYSLDSACVEVHRLAMQAGMDDNGAVECAAAYRKRWLFASRPQNICGATAKQCRQVRREVVWFVRRWIYGRTKLINRVHPQGDEQIGSGSVTASNSGPPAFEQVILRNIDMNVIAEIVATFSPSQQWLWRRVEIDGARLKDLALEIGSTADALDHILDNIRWKIRRTMDGDDGI